MQANGIGDGSEGVVTILADRIGALARDLVDGSTPMVVDALAEAWSMGMSSAVGLGALVESARRGSIVVCCPLGRPEPAAAILPMDVGIGMTLDQVLHVLGTPDEAGGSAGAVTWLHALPFAGNDEDVSDGRPYALRQAEWRRPAASVDDPPFAPLVAGERMFFRTDFSGGTVIGARAVVLDASAGTSRRVNPK